VGEHGAGLVLVRESWGLCGSAPNGHSVFAFGVWCVVCYWC